MKEKIFRIFSSNIKIRVSGRNINNFIKRIIKNNIKIVKLTPRSHKEVDLIIDYNLIVNGEPTVNSENWQKFSGYPKPLEFAFGYVITCHKSEGSEYNRVVVFDEAFGDYKQQMQWRYTAITRSVNQLVIVV